MNLKEIHFPVSYIGKTQPTVMDGRVFIPKKSGEDITLFIIDDLRIPKETLGMRRLALSKDSSITLYNINKVIFFIGDLLKQSDPHSWFIDNNGKVFRYTKTRGVPLIYKKILEVIPAVGCYYISVEGLNSRYISLFAPTSYQKYAAVLKLSVHSYLLYGFSEEYRKPTRRKV